LTPEAVHRMAALSAAAGGTPSGLQQTVAAFEENELGVQQCRDASCSWQFSGNLSALLAPHDSRPPSQLQEFAARIGWKRTKRVAE
jgi:hypothetical protein